MILYAEEINDETFKAVVTEHVVAVPSIPESKKSIELLDPT